MPTLLAQLCNHVCSGGRRACVECSHTDAILANYRRGRSASIYNLVTDLQLGIDSFLNAQEIDFKTCVCQEFEIINGNKYCRACFVRECEEHPRLNPNPKHWSENGKED